MKTAVINGIIVTMDKQNLILHNGTLTFEDDTITYIGQGLTEAELEEYEEVIDAKGNIIMPGLINTHGHGTMALLRGYGDDLPLKEWLENKMWPVEASFTKEDISWGTELAILEMLKTGTTTFSDMYIHMDIVAERVGHAGIRANLSRGIIGFGNEELKAAKLKEAKTFAANFNKTSDGRITTMLSPHSIYTCDPEFISQINEAARDIGVPVQIHLSETKAEVEQTVNTYGKRPVHLLKEIGLFDNPTLIAHAVHVDNEEIMILKEYDVKVSHNPGSNLKLGNGIAPVLEMLNNGIHVSLGTDSAASNNNLDMFEEMRLAALIHKGYHQNPIAIPAENALRMATVYGAEALFIEQQTGTLEIGKKADFIIIDTEQAHFQPFYQSISHLVYAASGRDVKDVVVNGEWIIHKREILTMDEERILFEVNRLAKKWQ